MVAVITGTSSGIGLATARYLTAKGVKVYGLSRTIVAGEEFESISCDVTNHTATKTALQQIAEKEGRIDVLVNNAGMGISGATEHNSDEEIQRIFDVNIMAVINTCKTVAEIMRNQGGGRIINIGSVAGVIPIPFQTCYSTTKSAVQMFSLAFGLEVEEFGIKVSCVLPGDTKTGFTDNRVKSETETGYAQRVQRSVARMERDERAGKSPVSVSEVVWKLIKSKHPAKTKTVGLSYKLIVFLQKILPQRLMLWVVKKMYG